MVGKFLNEQLPSMESTKEAINSFEKKKDSANPTYRFLKRKYEEGEDGSELALVAFVATIKSKLF